MPAHPPAFLFIFFPSSLFLFIFFSSSSLHFLHFLVFPFFPSHPSPVHRDPHFVLCNFFSPPPRKFLKSSNSPPPSSLEFNSTELRLCCILLRCSPNIPSQLRVYSLMARYKAGPPWSDAEKVSISTSFPASAQFFSSAVALQIFAHDFGVLMIDSHICQQIQLLLEIANQVNSDPNWKSINVPEGL